jgi:hypothetical protein
MRGPALARLAALTLAGVVCASPASAQGSTGSSTNPPQTPTQAPSVPQNLDRIRDRVNTPPTLVVTDGQLRIYVEVIGHWPTFWEYTKGTDFLKGGPAGSRGAITHNELLGSLTPKELYGSGGISAGELLQGAVVNWLGQMIIKKGLKEISEARNSDEIAKIRARIDRELEALKGGK